MKTTECATDGCERGVTVESDAEGVRCLACADVGHGSRYAARQVKSQRAAERRRNLVNYGRSKR